MAGRFNSHRHKKFNRYTASTSAKRVGFSPYLIILISAVAALILALLLGTFLGKLADSVERPDEPGEVEKNEPIPLLDVNHIRGEMITLEGIVDSTAQNVRAQIPKEATAVSMILFDESGAPYYRSEVAEAFGNPCGELTLTRVFEGITVGDKMLYSSIILPSTALNNTEGAKQAVLNAYEAALIEELYLAGACDVILTPFKLGDEEYTIDNSFIAKLETYVASVRILAPTVRIGLALPIEYVSLTEHSMLLEELSKRVDFLALDLTARTDIESFSDAVSEASLNVLRREMRLLLADASVDETAAIISLIEKYSMTNYQIAIKK